MLKPALVSQNYFTYHGNRNQILKKLNKIANISPVMFQVSKYFVFLFFIQCLCKILALGAFFSQNFTKYLVNTFSSIEYTSQNYHL